MIMKKIFNRFRKAAKDYDLSMLPQTRKEVFLDVLKLNWKSFLLYGLLFLVFSLPLQLVTLSESMAVINLQNAGGEIPREQIPYMISMTRILAAVVKLPCFSLLAVAISGFARVIRQYAWMENVKFSYEFWQGIKGNAGQMLLLAVLAGVINLVATLFITVSETTTDFISSVIMLAPTAIIILCLVPVFAYMVVSISVYKSGFGGHFRVGRTVYAQSMRKTLLALPCCFMPFVLQVMPAFICQILGAVLSPLLAPIVFLGWYLFALDGLDAYINAEHYPSLVGRGLYDPEGAEKDKML